MGTAVVLMASIHSKNAAGGTNQTTFKLKIGPTSSESIVQTIILKQDFDESASDGGEVGGSMLYVDNTQTWSAEVTVLVTAQNSVNNANAVGTCFQLLAIGV